MALVVEDGSIVADANSYATVAEIKAYALTRGSNLNAKQDTQVEILAIKAMDWLEAQRARYQGYKTDPVNQTLQWPRGDVYIDCYEFDENSIPQQLKDAQCQLCIEQNNGVELFPSNDPNILRERIEDFIEIEYRNSNNNGAPSMSAVDSLMRVLYYPCGHSGGFTVHT